MKFLKENELCSISGGDCTATAVVINGDTKAILPVDLGRQAFENGPFQLVPDPSCQ